MRDLTDNRTMDAFGQSRKRGGARPGAGRPKTAELSKVVRVPLSKLDAVQAALSGSDSVLSALEVARGLAERWARACAGRENQPRWAKAHELVKELEAVLSVQADKQG